MNSKHIQVDEVQEKIDRLEFANRSTEARIEELLAELWNCKIRLSQRQEQIETLRQELRKAKEGVEHSNGHSPQALIDDIVERYSQYRDVVTEQWK